MDLKISDDEIVNIEPFTVNPLQTEPQENLHSSESVSHRNTSSSEMKQPYSQNDK